ncbi:D-hexose-6-phosphate mutarotase [bacterium]|nr:MAG: D-hexose-6-phosphate mutarotase [bacterium]
MLQKLDFPAAELYLQGAHLTRFKDWLFLSSRSNFTEGKAIRGGIPIVFPWFGPSRTDSSAPQHGWGRTSLWQLESQSHSDAILSLRHDSWQIRLTYSFGDMLSVRAEVQNIGTQADSFEVVLHTYFAVSDISAVSIEGLDGLTYLDKPSGNARFTQQGTLHFDGEIDRVYLNAPSPLRINDGTGGYELHGDWNAAVTWNPGAEKAAQLSDLGEGEWRKFVCLEIGAIADGAIQLEPGKVWTLNAEISKL